MKIAIEGCAHGELEKIYDLIGSIQAEQNITVDLLICCGDFQSTRNLQDLQCMAVPQKHLDMCSFYKYYSGEKKAPILTLFIGGNHEASNYLQELPYGGWVAPNIYYLGYAGVVDCNGIRIGGISGIFKGHDFLKGRFEFPPYDEASKRSVYHQRQIDVFRLKQLTPTVDVMLSHDWPRALDKCLPKRRFLQILDIPTESENDEKKAQDGNDVPSSVRLKYDLEWLTVLNLTNHLISIRSSNGYMPGEGGSDERFNFTPSEEEKAKVLERFNNDLTIPDNFVRIVGSYQPDEHVMDMRSVEQPQAFLNPQTTSFCDKLNIDDPLQLAMLMTGNKLNTSTYVDPQPEQNTKEKQQSTKEHQSRLSNADELDVDEDEEHDAEDRKEETEAGENSPKVQPKLSLSSVLPQPKWRPQPDTQDSDLSTTLNDSTPNCSVVSNATPPKIDDISTSTLSESVLAVDDLNLSSPRQQTDLANPTPVKKFKRRNETIYTKDDSD
uniref:Lariat debranching enzyme C-terminal domain-containing protein n=1 Tax=Anopheles maculatus TaxID=74869 RepID=A0A182T4A0_9DIPT